MSTTGLPAWMQERQAQEDAKGSTTPTPKESTTPKPESTPTTPSSSGGDMSGLPAWMQEKAKAAPSTPTPTAAPTTSAATSATSDPSLPAWMRERQSTPTASTPTASTTPKAEEHPQGIIDKAWSWVNKPLLDMHGKLQREGAGPVESGLEAGAEDIVSSFTSPLSVGLGLATLGAAPMAEAIGLKALSPTAIKMVGKAAGAGFSAWNLKNATDAYPTFKQAMENGDTKKATEVMTGMLASGAAGAASGVHAAKGTILPETPLTYGSKDGVRGHYTQMLKEDTEQALKFNAEAKKAVPDAAKREAIQMYSEAGGDPKTLLEWQNKLSTAPVKDAKNKIVPSSTTISSNGNPISMGVRDRALNAVKLAQNITPEEKLQVEKLRQLYDKDFDEAAAHDLLPDEKRKTNYAARSRWNHESPDDMESPVDKAKTALGESAPDHTKRRVFETTVDGILKGYEPSSLDAADIASDYHLAMGKQVALRQFVQKAESTLASDHRPYYVKSGSGHTVDETTFANSHTIPNRSVTKGFLKSLDKEAITKGIQDGTILDDGDGNYRFDTGGYEQVRSRHTSHYSWAGNDTMVQAYGAFHPEILDEAKAILAPEPSAIRQLPGVEKLLEVGSTAKQTLLSLSGFHWVQEGARGLESGVNPLKLSHWEMNDPRHVKLVESGGLQPGLIDQGNSFTETLNAGHGGLIGKIPGVGDMIGKLNNNLFGPSGFIDRLKLTSALKFEERLKKSYPNMDEMSRYKIAGEMSNARYGGLNYTALGRSRTMQDILRLGLLAPDWMESQARDVGMMMQFPKIGAVDLTRIAAYNFMTARALNYATTGKPHMEEPFGVVSQDGKKTFMVRTMPGDMWHLVSDPRGFVSNRLNPVVARTGLEALTGRDKYGKERDMKEQITDLFQNITPIPLQGVEDIATGNVRPNQSWWDSVASAGGVSTYPEHTPAEDLAAKFSSKRAGTGEMPSGDLERHHTIYKLEDRLRNGDQNALGEAQQLVEDGKMAPDDLKKIVKDSRISRLGSTVKALPLANSLDIWDRATNKEREDLAPVMLKKIANYHKTERHKLTPVQRDRMDTRLGQFVSTMLPPDQPETPATAPAPAAPAAAAPTASPASSNEGLPAWMQERMQK